jgi:hypothetical protein
MFGAGWPACLLVKVGGDKPIIKLSACFIPGFALTDSGQK